MNNVKHGKRVSLFYMYALIHSYIRVCILNDVALHFSAAAAASCAGYLNFTVAINYYHGHISLLQPMVLHVKLPF